VIAIAIWSSVLALSGTFDILTDLTIFVLWLFVGLTGTTIFVLRRKFPDAPRPYRVLGYPVIPIAFLLATAFMLVSMLASTPGRCLAGMGMVIIGLPVYSIIARRLPPDDPETWIGVE
jgi:APA family basic amino acid/polyamine antiporter